MRLGAITDEFSPDPAIAAKAMREAGLETAELRVLWGRNILDLTDEEVDRAVAIFEENELAIDSIASPLLKCALPGAPEIDARFQQDVFASRHTFSDQTRLAARAFDVAKRTGAKIVRVFSFWRVVDPSSLFERIVHALRDLAEQAAKRDLIIGLENEHACNLSTALDVARALAAIDHPNLQIVWDPANALIAGEKPFPVGFDLLPISRIAHVHAKDCQVNRHAANWMGLGDGEVNWTGQIAALVRGGYRGDINIETHWTGPHGNKMEASRICAWKLRQMVARLS